MRAPSVACISFLLSLLAQNVAAADVYTMRALGTFQGQLQSSKVERPFFEGLEKQTKGMFKVQFRTMDEIGAKGFDSMRQLKLGIFDVMEIQLGYVSGDDPFMLGIDLPGVAPDLMSARKVVDAYRDVFGKRLLARHNAHVLAIWPFPGQVFFCKGEIRGLSDLKGKKVRSFTPAMAKLLESFGATPVSIAFSEVYQSLQRGVVDCGITATLSGNTSKWFEVTDHLYPLSIGWGIQAHVASRTFYEKLSPAAQAELVKQFNELERRMWDLAFATFDDGINCNAGKSPCQYGTPGTMNIVPVREEDRLLLRRAAQTVVLPDWSKDCTASYPGCAAVWNSTVGKVSSLTATP